MKPKPHLLTSSPGKRSTERHESIARSILIILLIGGIHYSRAQGTTGLAQQAYVKASNTGANDAFGWSVAISGDTMVVGAHDEASNATGVNGNQNDNSVSRAGAA